MPRSPRCRRARPLLLVSFASALAASAPSSATAEDRGSAITAAAQVERPPRRASVQADLGSGVVGVGYERVITPSISARVTFQLQRPWYTQLFHGEASDVVGFGGEVRPFFFPLGTGARGLYVSPFLRLAAIRATDALPEAARGLGWSTGTTMGYGWLVFDERLLLRVGAGAQYWAFDLTDARGRTTGVRGVYPDVDLIAGYAF